MWCLDYLRQKPQHRPVNQPIQSHHRLCLDLFALLCFGVITFIHPSTHLQSINQSTLLLEQHQPVRQPLRIL